MSGTRGVSLAVLILCLSLGFSVMAGLGIGSDAGVQLTSGLGEQQKQVTGETSDISSQGGGEDFSSQSTGGIQTLNTLRILVVHTSSALQYNGVPRPIADAIQAVVDLSFVLAILFAVIRVKP